MRNPLLSVADDPVAKTRALDVGPAHGVGKMSPTTASASKQLNEDRRAILKEIDNAQFS